MGQTEEQVKGQPNYQAAEHVNLSTEALIKQKESKPKETKQEDVFVFYQKNFGVVSPFVAEDILGWVEDVGGELVVEAMKRGLERNKTSWGYVKSILQSWLRKGIHTVEAAGAEMVSADRGNASIGRGTGEVVPEWFLEQKRKSKMKNQEKVEPEKDETESVQELLEQYLSK